ncbi:hypothetical protein RRSWK_00337 [Rhodopirellula sp. SWK7]|nr:hypothetical protein RRSWK_00337 [Rhodopirellula sp. SWK7]
MLCIRESLPADKVGERWEPSLSGSVTRLTFLNRIFEVCWNDQDRTD